jgi:hypothetical protein
MTLRLGTIAVVVSGLTRDRASPSRDDRVDELRASSYSVIEAFWLWRLVDVCCTEPAFDDVTTIDVREVDLTSTAGEVADIVRTGVR